MSLLKEKIKKKGLPKTKRFENHKLKCRCCLEQLGNVSEVKEITPEIQAIFEKLTSIEVSC